MPAACALGMISGKIIFYFEIAERLRTLRYPIFIGDACFWHNHQKIRRKFVIYTFLPYFLRNSLHYAGNGGII